LPDVARAKNTHTASATTQPHIFLQKCLLATAGIFAFKGEMPLHIFAMIPGLIEAITFPSKKA
jgi:hypothetical protein